MVVASQAIVKPVEEDKEEVDKDSDVGEGSSTEEITHKQVPSRWETMPAAPRFWAAGPNDQVAKKGLAASSRAQGKVPAIQAELLPLPRQRKSFFHQL